MSKPHSFGQYIQVLTYMVTTCITNMNSISGLAQDNQPPGNLIIHDWHQEKHLESPEN